jgi:hypothetical protein
MFELILFDLNKSLGKRQRPLLPWAETGRPIRGWADSPIWKQGREFPTTRAAAPATIPVSGSAMRRGTGMRGEASELWTQFGAAVGTLSGGARTASGGATSDKVMAWLSTAFKVRERGTVAARWRRGSDVPAPAQKVGDNDRWVPCDSNFPI